MTAIKEGESDVEIGNAKGPLGPQALVRVLTPNYIQNPCFSLAQLCPTITNIGKNVQVANMSLRMTQIVNKCKDNC